MTTFNVALTTIDSVKTFVGAVTKYDYDIDLSSGRYIVDAKSIMGIFSLDLTKPIRVEAHTDDAEALIAEIRPYIVD